MFYSSDLKSMWNTMECQSASVALSAERERHNENVFHIVIFPGIFLSGIGFNFWFLHCLLHLTAFSLLQGRLGLCGRFFDVFFRVFGVLLLNFYVVLTIHASVNKIDADWVWGTAECASHSASYQVILIQLVNTVGVVRFQNYFQSILESSDVYWSRHYGVCNS